MANLSYNEKQGLLVNTRMQENTELLKRLQDVINNIPESVATSIKNVFDVRQKELKNEQDKIYSNNQKSLF